MTYNLFLDDERHPPKGKTVWIIVRSFEEACELIIEHGLPQIMSLDHDLGDCPSGYDFANWLVEYVLDHDLRWSVDWRVHSMNPVGAENIRGLLENFEKFRGETLTNL